MSEHRATVVWQRESEDFDYQSYNRAHVWKFEGDIEVPASSAPEYLGEEDRVDPEQAFVAALSSCHMLTFLAVAAKRNFIVDRYVDRASGYLEKNDNGRLAVTRVTLRPDIRFARDATPTPEELEKLHHQAHKACFIANSVRSDIAIEPPATS